MEQRETKKRKRKASETILKSSFLSSRSVPKLSKFGQKTVPKLTKIGRKMVPGGSRSPPGPSRAIFSKKWSAPLFFEGVLGTKMEPWRVPRGAQERPRGAQEPPKSASGGVFFRSLFFDRFFIDFGSIFGLFLIPNIEENKVRMRSWFSSVFLTFFAMSR